MSICLYGSQKKQSAPLSFTIDTGALCFILGIESPVCALLDRIPSIVGQPWKKIIATVAQESLNVAVDLLLDSIDTESFCSLAPPDLPEEINFGDVFQFIASYVPPLSLAASSSPLLNKIAKFYLYAKWFEFCECKKREREPPLDNPAPIPRAVASCPAAQSSIDSLNNIIDFLNGRNQNIADGSATAYRITDRDSGEEEILNRETYEAILDEWRSNPNYGNVSEVTDSFDPPENENVTSIGCVSVTLFQKENSTSSIIFTSDGGGSFSLNKIAQIETPNIWSITYDESECCPPEEPPPTRFPQPPTGGDCTPVPPPRFCELFPDDPLCANVPPCNDDCDDGECETIEINATFFNCGEGRFQKIIEWKK